MSLDRRVLKNMALLLQGQLVTNAGNHAYEVALLLWLKELTGSAALMGLALLAANLPEVLLAPLGGKISDRYGRVKTMVAADLAAGLALCLVLAVVMGGAGTRLTVAALCAGNITLGICLSCFGPSVSALVPDLVPSRALAKANAAQQFCRVGGRLAGQGAGGFVFAALGPVGALAANAASFLASALSEVFIKVPGAEKPGQAREREVGSLLRGTLDSLNLLWRERDLRRLVSYIGFFHLTLSFLPVTLPFYAEHILDLAPGWFGLLIGTYTVGILSGFVLVGFIKTGMSRMTLISATGTLVGLLFAALGVVSGFIAAWAVLFLIGLGIGVIIVNLMTELQLKAPIEERGSIMGAAQAVGGASLPLGMVLAGIIIDFLYAMGGNYGMIVRSMALVSGAACLVLGLGRMLGKRGER